jgi:arylsulfatase A-like enzyme
MKRFSRRRLGFGVIIILIIAGVGVYLKNRTPQGKQLLSTQQRAAIRKGLPASYEALTPDAPEINKLRASLKDANVVICVLDAARKDHFGCYGYQRETTPNVDKIAKRAFVFQNHFSQYASTLPSTACLFSGEYPDTHGITDPIYDDDAGDLIELQPEPKFTLPIGLEAAGYRTVLFSANNRAAPSSGIGLGFQEAFYDHSLKQFKRRRESRFSPELIIRAFDGWLKKNQDKKFFAYLHFKPPHSPYEHPEEYSRLFEEQIPPGFRAEDYHPEQYLFPITIKKEIGKYPALPEWINKYDANLRYGDWGVGEAIKELEKYHLSGKTILIITADHGEGFGEHGFVWHCGGIYDEVTRIPLIIKMPGAAGPTQKIAAVTETVDLLPTVYDLLKVPWPTKEVQGKTLAPLLLGKADKINDYSFSRAADPGKYMIRDGRYALLLYENPKWRALYDAKTDPAFRKNLLAENPQIAKKFHEVFVKFALAQKYPPAEFLGGAVKAVKRTGKRVKMTPEMKRELEALGYMK